MKVNKVVIGVGSNIDPEQNIESAKNTIAEYLRIIKVSSFEETEPVGFKNQENFINGAFLIETEMDAQSLKLWLKELEKKLGREKTENKNGPRTIDLDIIVWNGEVVDSEVFERDFLTRSVKELLPEIKLG